MVSMNQRKLVALCFGSLVAYLSCAYAIQERRTKHASIDTVTSDIDDDDYQDDLSAMDEADRPTFAELGASFKPKFVEGPDGEKVLSFLQASPTSSDVAHDSVPLPKDDSKYAVVGEIDGLVKGKPVTVILGTAVGSRFDILLEQKATKDKPEFSFMVPKGKYYVKVEGTGYRLPGVAKVKLPCEKKKCPFSKPGDVIQVQKLGPTPGLYKYQWVLDKDAQYGVESLSQVQLADAAVITEGVAETTQALDYSDAAEKLKRNFGIELHGTWGAEYAARLLGIVDKWEWLKHYRTVKPSKQKWILTEETLYPQDILIVRKTRGQGAPSNKTDQQTASLIQTQQGQQLGQQQGQRFHNRMYHSNRGYLNQGYRNRHAYGYRQNQYSYSPRHNQYERRNQNPNQYQSTSQSQYQNPSQSQYQNPSQSQNLSWEGTRGRDQRNQSQRGNVRVRRESSSSQSQTLRGPSEENPTQTVKSTLMQLDSKETPESIDDEKYDQIVTISREAFTYAIKHAFEKKSKRGVYFSRRLHKALIRALCLHDPHLMREHFRNMHGVEILEPFELDRATNSRGRRVTQYMNEAYQSWFLHPEELVEIATSWAEYPIGMQKILGLKYILRRVNGTVNPESPTAPAIAYPSGPKNDSYIEFMEKAFKNYGDIPSLVLHELGHFIDINMTPLNLRQKWSEIGGWYEDSNDPDGWSTRQQTEFVSAYAHKKNPTEDFACSLSAYVMKPKLLQSRAPKKFEFIRDNIMNGAYYVTKASHEFSVLNLGNPDFMYPGRITKVTVEVNGKTSEDKEVYIELQLADNGENSCATRATFELKSSSGTTLFFDMYGENGCSHKLSTKVTMHKSQKRGVWTTDQITLTDDKYLRRVVGSADFGMRVWLDNDSEDYQAPRVITPSISLTLMKSYDQQEYFRVTWMAADDTKLGDRKAAYVAIGTQVEYQHSYGVWGTLSKTAKTAQDNWRNDMAVDGYLEVPLEKCEESQFTRRQNAGDIIFNTWKFDEEREFGGLSQSSVRDKLYKCFVLGINISAKEYTRTGQYYLLRLLTYDEAGNINDLQWPYGKGPSTYYRSKRTTPDNRRPEIRNITVRSEPTNRSKPNGETVVTVTFDARDTDSGIFYALGTIVDPFGARFRHQIDTDSSSKTWQRVTYEHLLPRGSIPGVWHLAEIQVEDNAGNRTIARLHEQVMVMQAL